MSMLRVVGLAWCASSLVCRTQLRRRAPLFATVVDVSPPQTATDNGRLLAEKLKGTNIYLVGMMGAPISYLSQTVLGCGKSSVGEALTRMIGSYAFVDTDATLETATNTTCAGMSHAGALDGPVERARDGINVICA